MLIFFPGLMICSTSLNPGQQHQTASHKDKQLIYYLVKLGKGLGVLNSFLAYDIFHLIMNFLECNPILSQGASVYTECYTSIEEGLCTRLSMNLGFLEDKTNSSRMRRNYPGKKL